MILKTYEWGDVSAPPLICIHGVGGHGGNFEHVATDRWSEHFRVVSFDLRGHGYSDWSPPWGFANYVDDIIDTLDSLGIDRAFWVGHSFGGRLIFELMARFPERVIRAVATEPVLEISPELAMHRANQELTGDVWDSLEDFVAARENVGADIDVQAYIADIADEFDPLPDGRVKRRTSQAAIVSIFGQFATPAPVPSERTISVPTMILYSPAFGLVTERQLDAYRPYLAEVVPVSGMHAVFTSAYEETTDAIERFFAEA